MITKDGKIVVVNGTALSFDSLIRRANSTTGKEDTTLVNAVQSLIDGYGGGGGHSILPDNITTTEIIHDEDWQTTATGNTLSFANKYLNYEDESDHKIYIAICEGNTASTSSKADFAYKIRSANGKLALSFSRGNSAIFIASAQASSPYLVSQGTIVKQIVIDLGL